jgi:multimeric flavodoxin WrbA
MNVLALNASPRMTNGNTHRILAPFLEGATQAGAAAETICVRQLTVRPCTACMACWFATPGTCAQKDDMASILPKVRATDILVLATPVYVDGMVGSLKVMLDRLLPLVLPDLEIRDGHVRHPRQGDYSVPRVVLISVCGFYEMDNFDPLVSHVQAICRNMGSELAGCLLRPHAHAMEALENFGQPATGVFEACRQAGQQVVSEGRIAPQVLADVSQTLLPRTMYLQGANEAFQRLKAEHGTTWPALSG